MLQTANLGYPRIGKQRELKFTLEKYWRGEIPISALRETARTIREGNWKTQISKGIDIIPTGDFSLYDHVLDHIFMFDAVPERFRNIPFSQPEDLYFSMARGYQHKNSKPIPAMEMTKWFDTNYHYIVPEIEPETTFSLHPEKLFDELQQAKILGINSRPVVLGPISFLLLAKSTQEGFEPIQKLDALLAVYDALFAKLFTEGVEWVQLDEPYLVTDLTAIEKKAYEQLFRHFMGKRKRPKVMLTAYFADLSHNLDLIAHSAFEGLHVDLSNTNHPQKIIGQLSHVDTISLGISDGRNIWRENFKQALNAIQNLLENNSDKHFQIAPSCSLLHLPYDVDVEADLDPEIKSWMAFAEQKLTYLSMLKQAIEGKPETTAYIEQNRLAIENRMSSNLVHSTAKHPGLDALEKSAYSRKSEFLARKKIQHENLSLPLFPTTTIGSFPQTREVRKARADLRKGTITLDAYRTFIKSEIKKTIDFQQNIGIDVLVHGEFERNDMVQYFAEKLDGFTFTKNGWVQSFGSRCVRPPIIYGDISRPKPMTIEWTTYAQSLTDKPMKGMLTGPVTILKWSFVRDDQPLSETCKQIAFAIRDEVLDLENAGTRIIQIDEPALREGLPIQRRHWEAYLDWAVKCFKISSSQVSDKTQIHTHMCYAEFNDIIDAIIKMDADVISIEASRSKMELFDAFGEQTYPNEIGPGVYDIHSPNTPSEEEMTTLLQKALALIPPDQLWVNPDCGLKTRRWEEVEPALRNMVIAAKSMRNSIEKGN